MDGVTFKMEGLEDTVANLDNLSKATGRNVLRRTLLNAGEPTADTAARLAPVERGILAFSVVVSMRPCRNRLVAMFRMSAFRCSDVRLSLRPFLL